MVATFAVIALIVTMFVIPFWIRRARKHKLVAKDINKIKASAAELGGLCVVIGFLAGILCFVAYDVFVNNSSASLVHLFAGLCSILIATLIGLSDDILGWKLGFKQWHKVLLSILAALPIVVINAGESLITIPFLGQINVGLFFPLLFVPIGIVGASNGFNMIAGFNGLEAGMGVLILSALGWIAYSLNQSIAAIFAFCMVGALIGFLFFNWYPAKIFPGDSLTYPVGTAIALVAILGNIEKSALIIFIPYFIEFILKARGRFQKESFGKPKKDGSLTNRYDKWYGLEHVMISFWEYTRFKSTEQKVVIGLLCIQCCFIGLSFASYYL